ncbi:MAG: hypothetical protein WBZ50_00375, partial [Nitrososphaeraceae archaeon]
SRKAAIISSTPACGGIRYYQSKLLNMLNMNPMATSYLSSFLTREIIWRVGLAQTLMYSVI